MYEIVIPIGKPSKFSGLNINFELNSAGNKLNPNTESIVYNKQLPVAIPLCSQFKKTFPLTPCRKVFLVVAMFCVGVHKKAVIR